MKLRRNLKVVEVCSNYFHLENQEVYFRSDLNTASDYIVLAQDTSFDASYHLHFIGRRKPDFLRKGEKNYCHAKQFFRKRKSSSQ